MSYEGGDYQASLFGYIYHGEQENDGDTPGGVVHAMIAGATLLIGDAVRLTAAFTVGKTNVAANYFNFMGIVVGGARTDFRVMQDDSAIGMQAALVNEVVLLGISGKFKVVADAAIAAGAAIQVGTVTAGRVDDPAAVSGIILGTALEAATNAGDKILALISHR
jgi:hypothetical protein